MGKFEYGLDIRSYKRIIVSLASCDDGIVISSTQHTFFLEAPIFKSCMLKYSGIKYQCWRLMFKWSAKNIDKRLYRLTAVR